MQKAFFQTENTYLLVWEDYLRCVSLPPTVALYHLRSAAACSRPKAVQQPLPSDPHSLSVPSSFKEAFIYRMPLAWRTSYPIFQCTAYIFIVVWAWAHWRGLKIFSECRTEWCSKDFQNEFSTPSLIKTALSYKVKLLWPLFCILKVQHWLGFGFSYWLQKLNTLCKLFLMTLLTERI